jgi:hypothetical protein
MHDSDSDAIEVRNASNEPHKKKRRPDALVCSMSFTVSTAEADELHKLARAARLTFSAFVRQRLGLRQTKPRKS